MPFRPDDIGTLHFCGIGGAGMSALAEYLFVQNYKIQGSDSTGDSAIIKRLQDMGIRITIGHDAKNVLDENGKPVGGMIYSAAIPADNPEMVAAKHHKIPLISRAELLGEVMRQKWSIGVTGTHGKTTTTSLVGTVLEGGNFDPTIINGGIINALGTNAKLGTSDWMVVEADEAFGTFLKLKPTIGVITNIDPEHLDYYETFENVKAAYKTYIESIPFYGFAVMCMDHPEVQALIPQLTDKRIITYGTSPQVEVQARDIRPTLDGNYFTVQLNPPLVSVPRTIKNMLMPVPGQHNVLNALAAVAIGVKLGIDDESIRQSLAAFSGVKRRFTKTGTVNGITIIDDYGHHPVEIAAVLKAGRSLLQDDQKLIAVMQPHLHSRVHDLFDEFCRCTYDADLIIVADVYKARGEPIVGCEKEDLVAGMIQAGHKHAMVLKTPDDLPALIAHHAKSGDLVIFLGAGTSTKWAHDLPEQLKALNPTSTHNAA
ncbi:MAG TPA: UDP-N-acetylmuramate--L-alanine ligase [Alphaproteobacteria bacterium]